MPMFLQKPLKTIAAAFEDIKRGEDPWIALGNFSNEWFMYARNRRVELVADPPVQTDDFAREDSEEKRWVTFMAASVEYLCGQYAVPCPAWVYDSCYQLIANWYDAVYVDREIQAWLEQTTPEPFKRRHIYCGANVFLDKTEVVDNIALVAKDAL